jgi:hypothetical protein
MMGRHSTLTAYAVVAASLAAVLAVCVSLCPREPAWDRDRPAITDVSAMRIHPEQRTERLQVFRVTYDGEAVVGGDPAGGDGAGPILRVDLSIEGKPFTVWVRER